MRPARPILCAALACALAGCADHARLTVADGTGPDPNLPAPRPQTIPTVKVAPAIGWPAGEMPEPAAGLSVRAFASGLDHPRWLLVLPNGDVLVAETNAPVRPAEGKGVRAWFMKRAMQKAGAGTPSADRISLLRDADGDGVAERRTPLLTGLHSPFGMALVGDTLYVANTDGVVGFPYREGDTQITAPGHPLAPLPAGERNHHWTKNLIASADGTTLYATVGSNSNVAEHGMEEERGRAAIWAIDLPKGEQTLFASGLRNPNGMAWEPDTGLLWTVVNERDEIGSDLVPDYLTAVHPGAFYGWPYSWYGAHVDRRVKPPRPDLVETARKPDYALGPHVAALGLAWSGEQQLGADYAAGMFIGLHGSWNRVPPSGYQVIFVPFKDGQPDGAPRVVLDRFLDARGQARGRPVAVAVDRRGGLLVADDVGNTVWRVEAAAGG